MSDCEARVPLEKVVDGEAARTAAAVAAAREEQREACARNIRQTTITHNWQPPSRACADLCESMVRTSKLTATPLADRIAELEKAHVVMADAMHRMEAQRNGARDRIAELERERAKSATLEAHALDRAEKAETELAQLKKAVTDKLHYDMKALLSGGPEKEKP